MRALLVTEYSPFGTEFGAQQRTHLLWNALCELGQVDVLLLRPGHKAAAEAASDERIAVEASFRDLPLGLRKYSPDHELCRLVAKRMDVGSYDVICGRYLGPISKLELPARVPSVVDLDDVGYTYASRGAFLQRIVAVGKSARRRQLERGALRRFARYWFVCERDRGRFPGLRGAVLPNVPVSTTYATDFCSWGRTLLFVGALWYGPNREGIERFLSACWPEIRRAEPGARLVLIGGAPPADRARWSQTDGVTAPGFVKDLAAAYAEAAFTVAPIYSGGGSNIKVLESLAQARACVTTAYCLEGFRPHFNGTGDILATADDAGMVKACVGLLRDPGLRESLARTGQQVVARHYSWEVFRQAVHEQVGLATRMGGEPTRP